MNRRLTVQLLLDLFMRVLARVSEIPAIRLRRIASSNGLTLTALLTVFHQKRVDPILRLFLTIKQLLVNMILRESGAS